MEEEHARACRACAFEGGTTPTPRSSSTPSPAVTMGLEGELKHEEDEVERKLIHEIVKHLPVVPDQARTHAK